MTLTADDLHGRDFKRILLVKLSAVGDVVHTIPLLNKLRRRYPRARLDWLIAPAIAELIRHHPAVTNVIEFPRARGAVGSRLATLASYAGLAAKLRAARYDLVIDVHGQARSAALALAAGAPVRIGFDRPRAEVWEATARQFPPETRKHAWQGAREASWIAYTHRIPVPTLDIHPTDRYLNVGPMLGLDSAPADFSFPIPAEARARIDALLTHNAIAKAPLVAIAPGTVWETKRWRSEGFAEVARHFLQKDFAVAIIGTGGERDVCAEVTRLAPGSVNLAGETTLSELAALLERSALAVTNDSGPMHLAVALDRPVVSIFGPTDPIWAGPYQRADAILQANIPCSPCYLRQLSRCTHAHLCMQQVSARAVIERADQVLRQHGSARPAPAQTGAR